MKDGVVWAYDRAVSHGDLRLDDSQRRVAMRLDKLATDLAQERGLLSRLLPRRQPLRSIYIQGDVGRGKTMVMDLFFAAAPLNEKRRSHFHDFMQEMHAAIFELRKAGRDQKLDAVIAAGRAVAAETRLLCLDEFQVNDIADAMILGRLFEALLYGGTVIVVTSNTAPSDLYRHGLNRDAFLPFIRLIENRFDLLRIEGKIDYRLDRVGGEQVYFCPLGVGADSRVQWLWKRLTDTDRGHPVTLLVKGRKLIVPQAAKRAARFDFRELCAAALGPADYLAIAAVFDTVFLEHIPALKPEQLNEARRFVNLIDTLYDRQIRLVASAETPPDGIYATGRNSFEFVRAVSRLKEMLSASYWSAGPDRARAAILT